MNTISTDLIEKDQVKNILSDGIEQNQVLKNYISQEDLDNIVNNSFHNYGNILKNDFKSQLVKKKSPFFESETLLSHQKGSIITNSSRLIETNKIKNFNNTEFEFSEREEISKINYEEFSIIFNTSTSMTCWMSINTKELKNFIKKEESNGSSCF